MHILQLTRGKNNENNNNINTNSILLLYALPRHLNSDCIQTDSTPLHFPHEMHSQCIQIHSVYFLSGQFISGDCLAAFHFQLHYSTILPYTREYMHYDVCIVRIYVTITSHNQNVVHRHTDRLVVRCVQHVFALIKSNDLYLCSKFKQQS